MAVKERIIIIGGGFAGLSLIEKLNTRNKEILLIDKINHHMFQPLFYQVATGKINSSNISVPFRKIFQQKKIDYKMTEVTQIIPDKNTIITREQEFVYDKLIIATGCKTNFFGNENIQKYSFGMKTTQEAIDIRNHILSNFEKLALGNGGDDEGCWNIVIVGSGATGVELAGAFSEMKTDILPKDYPHIDWRKFRIILISATQKPLITMSEIAQNKTEKYHVFD